MGSSRMGSYGRGFHEQGQVFGDGRDSQVRAGLLGTGTGLWDGQGLPLWAGLPGVQ